MNIHLKEYICFYYPSFATMFTKVNYSLDALKNLTLMVHQPYASCGILIRTKINIATFMGSFKNYITQKSWTLTYRNGLQDVNVQKFLRCVISEWSISTYYHEFCGPQSSANKIKSKIYIYLPLYIWSQSILGKFLAKKSQGNWLVLYFDN